MFGNIEWLFPSTGYVEGMGALFVEWQKFFDVGAAEVGWVGILTALNGPFGCK